MKIGFTEVVRNWLVYCKVKGLWAFLRPKKVRQPVDNYYLPSRLAQAKYGLVIEASDFFDLFFSSGLLPHHTTIHLFSLENVFFKIMSALKCALITFPLRDVHLHLHYFCSVTVYDI